MIPLSEVSSNMFGFFGRSSQSKVSTSRLAGVVVLTGFGSSGCVLTGSSAASGPPWCGAT